MQTEKTGVIYRIYHRESMKSYVGKSVDPERRICDHLGGRSSSPALRNAIKKYGKDAFCVEILESDVQEAILSKMEILHIRFFNCKAPYGYNLTDGGEGISGLQFSLETRQKMSESLKGIPAWNKGKTGVYSDETRQKMSESKKGIPAWNRGKTGVYSDETLRKISESKKGIPAWNKGKTGVYSDETLQKMSEVRKGRACSPETRRKISEANKGENNPNFGRRHTLEARQKMSDSKKGKPSPKKGKKTGKNPWNKGKTGVYSDEHRQKISESLKRRNRSS